jgi:hypothetical protein
VNFGCFGSVFFFLCLPSFFYPSMTSGMSFCLGWTRIRWEVLSRKASYTVVTFGLGRSFGLKLSVAVVVVLMVASLEFMVLIQLHLFIITVCSRSTLKESAVVLLSCLLLSPLVLNTSPLYFGLSLCESLAYVFNYSRNGRPQRVIGSVATPVLVAWKRCNSCSTTNDSRPVKLRTLLVELSNAYGSDRRSGVWFSDGSPLGHMVFVGIILHSFSGCSNEYSTWTFADENPVKVAPEMVSESNDETLICMIQYRNEIPMENSVNDQSSILEVGNPCGRYTNCRLVGIQGSHKQHRFNMLGLAIINKTLPHTASINVSDCWSSDQLLL